MALLEGINYDYSKQQKSKIRNKTISDETHIFLQNTAGFELNDYILIEPFTENAEICSITEVLNPYELNITATKFPHKENALVFRLPYNKMRFYVAQNQDGPFTMIVEKEMTYDQEFTNHEYTAALPTDYYKRTFYNEITDSETDLAFSGYWNILVKDDYITAEEVRTFLQFGINDYPNPQDMQQLIQVASIKLKADINSGDRDKLKYALLLLSKFQVFRALASKALSKGYIQLNAEGRTVMKSYRELLQEAEATMQEYQEFLNNNFRKEGSITQPIYRSGRVTSETLNDIKSNMYGVNTAINYESTRFYRSRRP